MENIWVTLIVIGIVFGFLLIQKLFQMKREKHTNEEEE
jgi:hypothetical protein